MKKITTLLLKEDTKFKPNQAFNQPGSTSSRKSSKNKQDSKTSKQNIFKKIYEKTVSENKENIGSKSE